MFCVWYVLFSFMHAIRMMLCICLTVCCCPSFFNYQYSLPLSYFLYVCHFMFAWRLFCFLLALISPVNGSYQSTASNVSFACITLCTATQLNTCTGAACAVSHLILVVFAIMFMRYLVYQTKHEPPITNHHIFTCPSLVCVSDNLHEVLSPSFLHQLTGVRKDELRKFISHHPSW